MRTKARVDLNHREVIDALRAAGWRVADTSRLGGGFPDLFAFKPGRGWRAIEVKSGAGTLTPDQVAFHETFPAGCK